MAKDNATAVVAPRRSNRTRRQVESIYDDAAKVEALKMTSSGKRAKKKTSSPPLLNLPDSILLHIAGYVQETSRVLLAVALTASSSAWRKSTWDIQPSAASKVILSEKRIKNFGTTVDFVETEKELAAKLSDEDIGAVLACISAAHTIKIVKLTHCVGITGRGLEPLRGSVHLVQLDLSLVGKNESPNLNPEPSFSKRDVIPILDSILDSDGFSLKHVQYPKKWRDERSQMLGRFLAKYNRVMNARDIACFDYKYDEDGECEKCSSLCKGTTERPWVNKSGALFGTHSFTCYTCCASFCHGCSGGNIPDALCEKCEKRHCTDCSETLKCDTCDETTCHECTWIGQCETCERATCKHCCHVFLCDCCCENHCVRCVPFNFCQYPACYAANCDDCSDDTDNVKYCGECGEMFCAEHLMKEHVKQGADHFCSDCNARAASKLFKHNRLFDKWVTKMEEKYGIVGRVCLTSTSEDFSEALKEREQLRQRCRAVGNKLLLKQKQFERYDHFLEMFEV